MHIIHLYLHFFSIIIIIDGIGPILYIEYSKIEIIIDFLAVFNKYNLSVQCNNGLFYYKTIKNKFIELKNKIKRFDEY